MNYDLCFVGCGAGTLGALITLTDNNYTGNIVVIEKGKLARDRGSKDILNGVGGAGMHSDCKLSTSHSTGGVLNIPDELMYKYSDKILSIFSRFLGEELKWDQVAPYNTSDTSLTFDNHKTCHVGTERGRKIFKNVEEWLLKHNNITFITEAEVLNIDHEDNSFEVTYNEYGEDKTLKANKVIIATGQKNTLPGHIIKKFNITTIPGAIQLGVRVVDEINPQYEDIIKANYDFKFIKEYEFPSGIKTRVRTFCCNSGNAHVCEEKNSEGFSCFNGHAFKQPDPDNHSVNYGIICEAEGLEGWDKDKQIEVMKESNAVPTWKEDNFSNNEVVPKRELLKGFPQLKGIYPDEVIESLEDFVKEWSKLVDLSEAKYLYPEVKLNDGCKPLLTNEEETSYKNLYMLADCTGYTRGILKAFMKGMLFAESELRKGDSYGF